MSFQVKGLNGRIYNWNLSSYSEPNTNRSKLACKGLDVLKKIFPFDIILEEVFLPGCGLFADFYIHSRRLMIEVDGRQHHAHTSFFYKTKLDFFLAKKRDRLKEEWCSLNQIKIIRLYDDESAVEWERKIIQGTT